MTFQQCKDQVAKLDGFDTWNVDYEFKLNSTSLKLQLEKVARLYAVAALEQAMDEIEQADGAINTFVIINNIKKQLQ